MDEIEEISSADIPFAEMKKSVSSIPMHPSLKSLKNIEDNEIIDGENCKTFRQTPRTVKRSVTLWGPSLEYVHPEFITYELCERAVSHHDGAISFVPRDKVTPEEYHTLCMLAVSDNGFTLKYIPRDAMTTEIVEAAHNHTCCAIMFTPREFLTEELCWKSIRRNGEMLQYVPVEYVTEEMRKEAEECTARRKKESNERAAAMTEKLMRDGELTCPIQ